MQRPAGSSCSDRPPSCYEARQWPRMPSLCGTGNPRGDSETTQSAVPLVYPLSRSDLWTRVPHDRPRDVLLVGVLRTGALVTMHAVKGSRPDWREEGPLPYPVPAATGSNAAVVGECRGTNLYTLGSYCPLHWEPSPLSIVMGRAEYVAWHHGLDQLARTLQLEKFTVLPPSAPQTPWRGGAGPNHTAGSFICRQSRCGRRCHSSRNGSGQDRRCAGRKRGQFDLFSWSKCSGAGCASRSAHTLCRAVIVRRQRPLPISPAAIPAMSAMPPIATEYCVAAKYPDVPTTNYLSRVRECPLRARRQQSRAGEYGQ